MLLKIKFGSNGLEKQIEWGKKLDDFPKLLNFNGNKWEWFMYNNINVNDYELTFTQLPTYDPNYYADMINFEDLFTSSYNICACGAAYSSFNWDHMRFCSLWKPW